MQYDLVILGGGPAACAAAVYAARKQLNTLLVAEEIGGQSSVSHTIYNWIGTPEISGSDLASNLRKHIEQYTGDGNTLTIMTGSRAEGIQKSEIGFSVGIAGKESVSSKTILIATGSRRRKLEVPGADTFEYKGVMYCATCDGPLYADLPVAIVGGGNAAIDGALQLAQYATQVTILHRSPTFRADPISVEQLKKLPNVTIHTSVDILEVKGDQFVTSVSFKNKETGETAEIPVSAVFVEIGQLPNTEFAKDVTEIDEHGKIVVDPMNQRAKTAGIWAAGDCTNGLFHQNNIAAGDAVKAIEDLFSWIKTH